MSNTLRLADVVTIERGTTYKSALLDQPGPVLLGLGTIQRHGGFRRDSLRTYGGDSPEKLLVRPGELYASLKDVTQTADVLGAVARVPLDGPMGRLTQDTVRLDITKREIATEYLYWMLRTPEYREYCRASATGTTTMGLSREDFFSFEIPLPDAGRVAMVRLLEALDDKIVANDMACGLAAELSLAVFRQGTAGGASVVLRDVTCMVSRGVAPRYVQSNGLMVLNQKCIRSHVVTLASARLTAPAAARDDKLLKRNDVLVNSTGQGTLGRVARWLHEVDATGDSHISIVRFNSSQIDPVCAGYALQQLEGEIEALAEGSTGQTELRRDLLAGLSIAVPRRDVQVGLGEQLSSFDNLAMQLRAESQRLAATRDELLPLLMSGRIRVRDAEKVVEEVT